MSESKDVIDEVIEDNKNASRKTKMKWTSGKTLKAKSPQQLEEERRAKVMEEFKDRPEVVQVVMADVKESRPRKPDRSCPVCFADFSKTAGKTRHEYKVHLADHARRGELVREEKHTVYEDDKPVERVVTILTPPTKFTPPKATPKGVPR